jgi:hypothetical protein
MTIQKVIFYCFEGRNETVDAEAFPDDEQQT